MSRGSAPQVPCPQCGRLLAWSPDNPWRPFCCERCKLIDLGAWATESYRLSVAGRPDGRDDGTGVPVADA